MKLSENCVLASFLFLSFLASAQENFQVGYVVLNSGDTLHGLIDAREWTKNPVLITFTNNGTTESAKFGVADLTYFETKGAKFERYTVRMSMEGIATRNSATPEAPYDSTKAVWLKALIQGESASLYSYTDSKKTRYFLQEKNSEPIELNYRLHRFPETATEPEHIGFLVIYKSQLLAAAEHIGPVSGKLKFQINKATYGPDLMKVVKMINGNMDLKMGFQTGDVHFFVGAGINHMSMSYSGTNQFAKNASGTGSDLPYFALGAEYRGRSPVNPFRLTAELSYSKASSHLKTYNYKGSHNQDILYDFSQSSFALSVTGNYNIVNKKDFKFFVGAGVRANTATYSTNVYTIIDYFSPTDIETQKIKDQFRLGKFWANGLFRVGFFLFNRVEVSATIATPVQLNRNTYVLTEKMNTLRAGVTYYIR